MGTAATRLVSGVIPIFTIQPLDKVEVLFTLLIRSPAPGKCLLFPPHLMLKHSSGTWSIHSGNEDSNQSNDAGPLTGRVLATCATEQNYEEVPLNFCMTKIKRACAQTKSSYCKYFSCPPMSTLKTVPPASSGIVKLFDLNVRRDSAYSNAGYCDVLFLIAYFNSNRST